MNAARRARRARTRRPGAAPTFAAALLVVAVALLALALRAGALVVALAADAAAGTASLAAWADESLTAYYGMTPQAVAGGFTIRVGPDGTWHTAPTAPAGDSRRSTRAGAA